MVRVALLGSAALLVALVLTYSRGGKAQPLSSGLAANRPMTMRGINSICRSPRYMRVPVQRKGALLKGRAGSNMLDLIKDMQNNIGKASTNETFLKQAQDMQKTMQESVKKTKEKLEAAEYDGYSSDETVRWVTNGALDTVNVEITQEAMKQGPEKLSQLLTEASQDAFKESALGMRASMTSFAQEMAQSNPLLSSMMPKPAPGGTPAPPTPGGLPSDQDDFPKM
eukprot:CAMPEP_0170178264 /NCGR_PEP_ID=MMETSP0040_2-20121228/11770_1 /TAXON_ID=641309 /ORGANISM="Lotharella oceanica, Strain CCMP622" /LENGTH=224 /DNA_ID=CAMNT_0010421275 /DNA_START=24 /DNA_END=698 /DNA_ORIENTATION=+